MKLFQYVSKTAAKILLLSFISQHQMLAQNYIDREETVNDVRNSLPIFRGPLILHDSLLLDLSSRLNVASGDSLSYVVLRVLRSKDLSIKNELVIDSLSLLSQGRFQLGLFGEGQILYAVKLANDTGKTKCYIYDDITDTLNLITEFNYENDRSVFSILNGFIYQNNIRSGNGVNDSVFLIKRDLNGQIVVRRDFDMSWTFQANNFGKNHVIGPYEDPNDSSRIAFGAPYPSLAFFDVHDLSFVKSTPNIFLPFRKSPSIIGDYYLGKHKFKAGGYGSFVRGYPSSPDPILQSAYVERSYDTAFAYAETFGDTNVAERCYAYHYDKYNDVNLLAGAANYYDASPIAAEFREVVLYRFNDHFRDSIRLYGNGNHTPATVTSDRFGNVYIGSGFSEAWTSGVSKYLITKIPQFALSLVRDKKVSPRIYVFPNPAKDFIELSGVYGSLQKVEVYNQAGQSLRQFKSPKDDQLYVGDLPQGIYILVAEDHNGLQHSCILKKQ